MTPEQTEELEALKAALKQHIEEAEKATPGPWTNDPLELGLVGEVSESNGQPVAQAQARQPSAAGKPDAERKANAAFIARARTMSPLACRIALEAIKALEEIVAEDKDQLMAADHDLIFILNLCKGGEA